MGEEEDMIEIPRFKKRQLNLGIVAGGAGQRAAWYALWAAWLAWGLFSLVSCLLRKTKVCADWISSLTST